MIEKKLKKFLTKESHIVIYVLTFAVAGSLLLFVAHAANFTANLEPEDGTSNTIVGSDSTASNGKYVQFSSLPRVAPSTFTIDGQAMLSSKLNLAKYNTAHNAALGGANYWYANAKVTSVMDKTQVPPSGDKHDYLSLAPYYWPNPPPDGLPYISKDGQVNPEFYDIADRQDFLDLSNALNALSAGYYFSGQLKYATKAEQIINTWFIASATKMNPNLNYAQEIKGVNTGSSFGIIDTSNLPQIIDSVKILQLSPAWTSADQAGFTNWCSQYLNWLQTSTFGKKEAQSINNHGTWYNAQVAALAEFVGNHTAAVQAISNVKTLINNEISSDGKQPNELKRTKPWNYSNFNLQALATMAQIARHENVDLWNFVGSNGGSIRKALDYLAPYANGSKVWATDYPSDLENPKFRAYITTIPLRQAAAAYNNQVYNTDADKAQGAGLSNDYSPLQY